MSPRDDLRWAVVLLQFDPVEGHEQAGQRPALVVSYEPFHRLGLMTVVPLTAARTAPQLPGDVAIPAGEAGLRRPGVIICSQVRTVSMRRIVSDRAIAGGLCYLTDAAIRRQVREALAHHLAWTCGRALMAPTEQPALATVPLHYGVSREPALSAPAPMQQALIASRLARPCPRPQWA